jgi:proteasome lid subunit RPN8/RPN11
VSPRILQISPRLTRRIAAEARSAAPAECCGLVVGHAVAGGWRAYEIHPAANVAADPARAFVIDPEVHFRLLRRLRGTNLGVIGCYHSHPGGTPAPSETDRAAAVDDGFLWLIAASTDVRACVFDAKARAYSDVAIESG